MSRYAAFISFLLAALSSCSTSENTLSVASLPKQTFSINTGRDTTVKTKSGSFINIPANALRSGTGTAELIVQEAITAYDMISAGLVTESDGRPLRSAGMICVKTGDHTEMAGALNIAISTEVMQPGMQLFKGEEKGDGINWTDPQPLAASPDSLLEAGMILFHHCASCHTLDKPGVANSLWNIRSRRNKDWLYAIVSNPPKAIQKSRYGQYLKARYGNVIMPAFPALSQKDLDALYAYTDYESAKNPERANDPGTRCEDSCYAFFSKPDSMGIHYRADTSEQTTKAGATTSVTPGNIPPEEPGNSSWEDLQVLRNGFTDMPSGKYYVFSIQTAGWYNIDAYVSGMPGTVKSKIDVEITGGTADMNLYLFIPARKMLSVSNWNNGTRYSFHKEGDSISIDNNVTAYLIAFSDRGEGKLFLGITSFTTATRNVLKIKVREVSKEAFDLQLRQISFEGIRFSSSKNEYVQSDSLYSGNDSITVEGVGRDSIALPPAPNGCSCREQSSR